MELNARFSVTSKIWMALTVVLSLGTGQASANALQRSAPAGSLVLDGVTVVDVARGDLLPDQRVVITGNRIQMVDNADAVAIPTDARVVDVRGKYLIPGLWDMHFHTTNHLQHLLLIANGVTGIRDATPSVPLDTFFRWRREILAGTRAGPPRQLLSVRFNEALWCGRRAPHEIKGAMCVEAGNTADIRRKIELLKTAGVDMIKMYTLSKTTYFLVAAEARRAGIPFGGHAEAVPYLAASDSGARILDHSTISTVLGTRCLFGKTASVEACRPIAERFARNSTWWVPTWVIPPHLAGRSRTMALYARSKEFVHQFWTDSASSYRGFRDYLRRAIDGDSPAPPNPFGLIHRPPPSGGNTPDSAGYLYVVRHAGLPVMAGTDANNVGVNSSSVSPGFSLHTEIATYVAEGMTPLEALQTATLNPAKFLRGTDSLGTIAPRKLADLVLLDANPLEDITNTTTIRAVVANGRYFDRAALDRLLAAARAKGP